MQPAPSRADPKGEDRQIDVTDGDGEVHYSYDGDNILWEGPSTPLRVTGSSQGSGTGTFYLNNISINSYEAEISSLRTTVFIKDALGSVRGELYDQPVTVPDGTPIDKQLTGAQAGPIQVNVKLFDYTAFGESRTALDGINADKAGIGFTGHYLDKETNLYYARARYYDPGAGRWMTPDPLSDFTPPGLNRYVYCANNPVMLTDPEGKTWWITALAIAAGAVCALIPGVGIGIGMVVAGAIMGADTAVSTAYAHGIRNTGELILAGIGGAVVGGVLGAAAGGANAAITAAAGTSASVLGGVGVAASSAIMAAGNAGINLTTQLAVEGGDMRRVDWKSVGMSAAEGASIGSSLGIADAFRSSLLSQGLTSSAADLGYAGLGSALGLGVLAAGAQGRVGSTDYANAYNPNARVNEKSSDQAVQEFENQARTDSSHRMVGPAQATVATIVRAAAITAILSMFI